MAKLLVWLLSVVGCLPSPAQEPPRLVVVVVVDQLASWVVSDARPHLPPEDDAFGWFETVGMGFPRCAYRHSATLTGPGHATVSTGASPRRHGIVGNSWFDPILDRAVYCTEDLGRTGVGAETAPSNVGPALLLAPTLGDTMKAHFGEASKVVSLSWKDRAAVLMAGPSADVVAWVDKKLGIYVSSSAYGPHLPAWLALHNGKSPLAPYFGSTWKRFGATGAYADLVDDRPFEVSSPTGSRVLPRVITGGLKEPGPQFFDELSGTPFANEDLLAVALEAVTAESLGRDDVPDLLCLSFSANDIGGHRHGPRSHEARDLTLRVSRLLRDLGKALDQKVGLEHCALAVTADHGIGAIPEAVTAVRVGGGRGALLLGAGIEAEKDLRAAFGEPPAGFPRWVKSFNSPCLFLDHSAFKAGSRSVLEGARIAARAARRAAGVLDAFCTDDLDGTPHDPESIEGRVRATIYRERLGDVIVTLRPYWLDTTTIAATHGSVFGYDREVPLWLVPPKGDRRWRRGIHDEMVGPGLGVVFLAELLGIPAPALAEEVLPPGIRSAK